MQKEEPRCSWDTKLERLIEWLKKSEGFAVNENVVLRDTEQSGRGLYLNSGKLRKNEIVISIASANQLNFHTAIYHISQFNPELVVEGVTCAETLSESLDDRIDPRFRAYKILTNSEALRLSSFQLLCLYIIFEWKLLPLWAGSESFWKPFFDVFPTAYELRSIPATWICHERSSNKSLLKHLPTASKLHAENIAKKIEADWQVILPIIRYWLREFKDFILFDNEQIYSMFVHVYFIINSRCLYIDVPLKEDVVDNLTLVPLVDFLNHNDDSQISCMPRIDRFQKKTSGLGKFSIVCGEHEYKTVGEEILLSYGPHSNDFLLNEYGFTLTENTWNYIDVSAEVEKLISDESDRAFLREKGYWGEYTISQSDISFRLLVAFAAKVCPDYKKVEKFMQGYISENSFKPQLQSLMKSFLSSLLKDMEEGLESVRNENEVDPFCAYNISNIYEGYVRILRHHLEDNC